MSAPIDDEVAAFSDSIRRRRLLAGAVGMLALGLALNISYFTGSNERFQAVATAPPSSSSSGPQYAASSLEGKMGKPTSKSRSGLYAMKGPKSSVPQMAKKDEDVWGGLSGTDIGESYGAGGIGLVGTGRGGGGTGEGTIGLGNTGLIGKGRGKGSSSTREKAAEPIGATRALPADLIPQAGFTAVADDPMSTFSIDVDTASYSASRRSLRNGQLPHPQSVRIEEFINYFDYDYPSPQGDAPFSVTAEVGECPWNAEHRLVHVGLQGQTIAPEDLPARNLVFLIDTSGSMSGPDKLPLVQRSLRALVRTLRAEDRISIVAYAGGAGLVLPPTPGNDVIVPHALSRLLAGGGTNGEAGIEQAYAQAKKAFIEDGVNRVILATDGDFNVGLSSHQALIRLIEAKRRRGIELSVLGYGIGHRDHTMEQLADKGNGNYAYIDNMAEAQKVLVEQAAGTLVTIAKDVKIQVEMDPSRVERYRLIGYDNRRLAHRDFADDSKDAGEIGAGHTVTALYEVVPATGAAPDNPWMSLHLRYKAPKGRRSTLLTLPVVASSRTMSQTSNDFRFSAAVASFGMLLSDFPDRGDISWGATRALALGALGDDPLCRRHEFTQLVTRASGLGEGESLAPLDGSCEPGPPRQPSDSESTAPSRPQPAASPAHAQVEAMPDPVPEPERDWATWALEVLRLLPPLLALPLFFMALRRPRRRRS